MNNVEKKIVITIQENNDLVAIVCSDGRNEVIYSCEKMNQDQILDLLKRDISSSGGSYTISDYPMPVTK